MEDIKGVALSTKDNPFDPFEQMDDWYRFDMEKGYDSYGYLARVARVLDDMTEQEYVEALERAIDDIIKYDVMDIYIKVKEK